MEAGGLVGRDPELERIGVLLRDAAAGRPSALLVAGEPGIGKTSLVTEAISRPTAEGHLVLWGRCLRFGADSTPYLPFGQILTQWHRQAEEAERRRVLEGADLLSTIAPSLGVPTRPADSNRMLPLVAATLDRMTQHATLVLVVDDVQWADGSSLDLLAYLLAGFDRQRLALLLTYRDTELAEGHRLHGWLADVLRLPSVSSMRLERLGFADVEELCSRLTGASGGDDAAAVYEESSGNPYYAELLVRDANAGLRTERDGSLRQALLSSWHGLGVDARELLQLLAVGGRPVAVEVLTRLVRARGGTPDQASVSLAEASGAGMVYLMGDGDAWFHHPLIAEVVASTLTPTARRRVHEEYVEVLEAAVDLPLSSRAAHLALHHDGAGDADPAFVWSVMAADEAVAVRGYAEACEHLHRACRLWDDVGDDIRALAGDRVDLWRRASDSAWSAGEYVLAVRLREEAVTRVDPGVDPVRAVRLGLPLPHWREASGLEAGAALTESASRVADLATHLCPGTPEHAQSLARLAFAELSGDDQASAARHASEAVSIATRTGSTEALAWALSVRSETRLDAEAALTEALEAVTLANHVGDPELMGVAAGQGANSFERLGRRVHAAELLLTTFRRLLGSGSAHDAMWANPSFGAALLIALGRWDEAGDMLHELLSRRYPPSHAADVRGQAATLALRSGRLAAGHAHLARAHELLPGLPEFKDLLAWAEIEGLWVGRDFPEALSRATVLMKDLTQVDATIGDELLPVAARIAADLAEQPGRRTEAQTLLDRVERVRGTEPDRFTPAVPDDLLHPAWGRIYAAERARCDDEPDPAPLWRSAVAACRAAGLVWDEALSSHQLARALLSSRGGGREAASVLRHAAQVATGLGATGVLGAIEALAQQAHVVLVEPPPIESVDPWPDAFPALTPREREVLSPLLAGRTYAEIAAALFISEKTVSVHVSNLLRKTGTSSRVELAELARRRP
ncbi:helix-turn-helix transcriptional regulator [Nocardioides euryhalodurans]|uniref:Helix-turn-helix transcriptional regulator n=1 Tax=Nocardioides euryhalodurans TaxID=2518370 RepID=A0A4P7GI31_9ACTN|nr:helix-turn-helix transcriptional regulator [Nocardioides euryhalodurans]QBR91463.1 helix-turn-helix transcriptional regulator [Nocardioides euryhalodurans]